MTNCWSAFSVSPARFKGSVSVCVTQCHGGASMSAGMLGMELEEVEDGEEVTGRAAGSVQHHGRWTQIEFLRRRPDL
jgi:hypothetical protein